MKLKVYQSAVTFYIGLASITTSYLSDVVVDASPKDGKTKKKSLPSSRVTKQQFQVLLSHFLLLVVLVQLLTQKLLL